MRSLGRQVSNADDEPQSHGVVRLAVRFGLTLAVLMLVSALLSRYFASELQDAARYFYDRFGVWGAAIGTWLADGINAPIPPQAYLMLAEADGTSAQVLPAVILGSLLGGVTGYLVAPLLMRITYVRALVQRTEPKLRPLLGKHWLLSGLLLSISPVPFSWLCYSAALYRLPIRTLTLLCVLRIPKLILYQQVISWGWS